MNKKDIFPSRYLKAGDLPEDGAVLTIRTVEVERMMDGEEKPVMFFAEQRLPNGEPAKPMIVNVTKWNTLAKLYGDESDDWGGKRVTLKPGEVKMKGEMVACIDISSRKPGEAKKPNGAASKRKGGPEAEAAIKAAGGTSREAGDESDDFDNDLAF